MSSKKLNVVVAGGSLAGLLYGLILKRHGHNVTILEKNATSSMTNLGAGLSCSKEMETFMSQYDLVKKPFLIETAGITSMDIHGEATEVKTMAAYRQKSSNWDTLYYRLRANFDGFRSGYCDVPVGKEGDGVVGYWDGCTVEDVWRENGEEGVSVIYRDEKGEQIMIEGDLLIATDGPGSRVRKIFQPDVERKYVGYVGWRGTVAEGQISGKSREALGAAPVICPIDNSCTISYLIPGTNGDISEGQRVYNWVWYRHYVFESEEYNDLMTDSVTNTTHRYTLPLGHLLPKHATMLKDHAANLVAPCIAEMIQKTQHPFIQSITDLVSPKAVFCGAKVLLAGDALATLRPMSGLGINSAARSAMMFLKVLDGNMGLEEWEREALEFAGKAREAGIRNSKSFSLRNSPEEAEEAEKNVQRAWNKL